MGRNPGPRGSPPVSLSRRGAGRPARPAHHTDLVPEVIHEKRKRKPTKELATTPPGHDVILFDGHCRLCRGATKQFERLLGNSGSELRSFREEGVLDAFPCISLARCEQKMQLVQADGRVFEGAEAVVQALGRRRLGKLLFVYYVPGLRQVADWLYGLIARHRFRIAGKACTDGACALHLK